MEIWVAFITGLTTGGLSCMAVQGGLLASSLAGQLEKDMQQKRIKNLHIAPPILLFLLAKLAAYTLLGFLLGALGSMLQLTLTMRAVLQFLIGVFMIGNALRMLNVHPFFRIFSFEPPAALTRFIRKYSKKEANWVTPLVLGALTVFIPCGVTQTMMAVALGSGNPLFGAAIMFAFVLGTSPVFFALVYLAARLGTRLEKNFNRFTAVVILLLGILAINSGLNLLGSPISLNRLVGLQTTSAPQSSEALAPAITAPEISQAETASVPTEASQPLELTLYVRNNGYDPQVLHAFPDRPVTFKLVTENTRSCSRAFTIPELRVEQILEQTGTQTVQIPAQPYGKVLAFSCSMGMYTGQIVFDQ
jgi:sulfite exporter TauE/SafE